MVRGYRKKNRNSEKRATKHTLLIGAEGNNKTETTYFQNFTGDKVTVRTIEGNDTSPIQLLANLEQAITEHDLQPGDLAVCLVDADFNPSKDTQLKAADLEVKKAKRAANKKGVNIMLIVSNPCFEKWFLCHFSASTRNYNSSKEILDELKKYIKGYSKSQDVYKEYLQGKTAIAVKNAKILEQHCLDSGLHPHTVSFTPSTEVYKVFEEFLFKYLKEKEKI